MNYSEYLQEQEKYRDEQIEKGIEHEMEHMDVYEKLEKVFQKNNLKFPMDKREFAKQIALVHIKEVPDYYDKLEQMMGH